MMKFPPLVTKSITKTYVGHAHYEGQEIWGNYLYLQIVPELLDGILLEELRFHPQYINEIDEVDFVFFVFKFTPVQKMNIVIPFLMGKYSEIDRGYVRDNFPMYSANRTVSMNWRILCNDIWQIPHGTMPLREYWHRRMGQPVPVENEVWPKPQKELEIYDYYDSIVEREVAESETTSTRSVSKNSLGTHLTT